ncbi:ABC transporter permease [Asanoa ishikariensis]|uniref:Putative ABC transport system permease protein n=1 Tax=Asanoa ishikariensis TaxID=137265 RepID=A0A1H3L1C5_9ACTN|nr:FtsX-like permease family protein [Asanoa ishikariensis]GIF69569.1 ABC transporter permease [Asanoa ishikariensis]SDY58039.1 putative ABC transport system permease protein [Asanoa ishikariensis]
MISSPIPRLAVGTLSRHKGVYVGTFVAAVLAIALLAAGGTLLFSVLTAKPTADRFAAADVVVSGARSVQASSVKSKKEGKTKTKTKSERLTGAGVLPVDLAAKLAALPGVAAAVPDAAFPVAVTVDGHLVLGADGAPVIGHGWASAALAPFTLRDGAAPERDSVVVDADLAGRAGLSVGDALTVTTKTGEHQVTVAGVAAQHLAGQGALFVSDGAVAAVSGLTGPTAVAVRTADVAAFEAEAAPLVGDAAMWTGVDRVRADLPGALPDYIGAISVFGILLGVTAFAAVFVLVGTVALAVRQRLRELALLRAVGATPGQLRRLVGVEAVLLGLLSAVPALPLGMLIAHLIAGRFRDLGVVPAQFVVVLSPVVLLLAAVGGLVLTFVAARVAARRAARIAPAQALTESALAPAGGGVLRTVIAVLTAGGAVGVLGFVPLGGNLGLGMSFVASALLVCAVAAAAPVLVRPLTAAAGRLARLGGASAWLAGSNSRAQARRVAAVAVPLVLLFGITATMLLSGKLSENVVAQESAARNAAATVRVGDPAGLSPAAARSLATTPGVTGSATTIPTRAILVTGGKPEDYPAQGLATTGTPVLDLVVRNGELSGDGTFAASATLTKAQQWTVGDDVQIWLADGVPTTLRLSAVYERARGFGDLVLPAALVAAHDPRGLVSTVYLHTDDPAVANRIRATWPAATTPPAGDASTQKAAWELMVTIALVFTAVAVVNTFAIATVGRRNEYATLRLTGATVVQIRRMATMEAGIAIAVALFWGVLVTSIVLGAFGLAQDGGLHLIVDPLRYAGLVGTVLALGLVAGAVPIRAVVRGRQIPATAERG